ncbi:UNVERIFIED_CONTAM: hypothetical protein GTU68_042383 [Idotea baltica]|nr:hypothetical protein [Idotea baltica]
MGSRSDWETMKSCAEMLETLGVNYEASVVSAHRTPDLLFDFAENAAANGTKVIIAAAGGAAHLPGMVASKTLVPVIGVPIESKALKGLDSLLSIVQMPGGIPVATVAIGKAGATNSALLAASILATTDKKIAASLAEYRANLTKTVMNNRALSLKD